MAAKAPRWPLTTFRLHALLLLVLLHLSLMARPSSAASTPSGDVAALLKFRMKIVDRQNVLANWNDTLSGPPCMERRSNWTGVFCGPGGAVIKLVLERHNLGGVLDMSLNSLVDLKNLRSLSFMNNEFEGPMPAIAAFAGGLRTVYLSGNKLSGQIPDDAFSRMAALNRIHLARNNFFGPIPSSLAKVPKLMELMLEDNGFIGTIPDLRQRRLRANFSNNALEGPVPPGLSKLGLNAFIGNGKLCGPPLAIQCPPAPPVLPQPEDVAGAVGSASDPIARASTSALRNQPVQQDSSANLIAPTVIGIVAILALLIALILVIRRRRSDRDDDDEDSSMHRLAHAPSSKIRKAGSIKRVEAGGAAAASGGAAGGGGGRTRGGGDSGRLVFVLEGRTRFELQDLLRASAELLGSGSFGSSYKAIMTNGYGAVVKRFKEMNAVGREDFCEHMRRLGRLSNPNLLPLVAYYYRKEEKLLLFDYIPNGSLAHMLHGGHGSSVSKLDWCARLKVIKGVARGLAYLHTELPMLSLPHGHLKSSNVLLGEGFEPLLTDYALAPVMNKNHASQTMVAFKAPEIVQQSRTTKKADVWGLGILIIEVLTGKFPADYLLQGNEGTNMAGWVSSIVGDGSSISPDVFDKEMGDNWHLGEQEMMKLLQIGLACCEIDAEKRMDMEAALEKIEEVKGKDKGDRDNSSIASDLSFATAH